MLSGRIAMDKKTKLALITAVMMAGFASPVFADCLESGAAESCGGGSYGLYGESSPDYQPYSWGFRRDGPHASYERY